MRSTLSAVKRILLETPMFLAFVLMGLPFYTWIHLSGRWTGLIFWPFWLITTGALMISYMTPWKKVRAAMHLWGEACFWVCIYISIAFYIRLFILAAAGLFGANITPDIRLYSGWTAIFACALFYLAGVLNAMRVKTVHFMLKAPVMKKIRIVFLSDLHLGAFTTDNMLPHILRAVKKESPDAALIGGDIFDMEISELRDREKKKAQLSELCAAAKTFACLGNHDMLTAEPERDEWIKDSGITVLKDEAVKLSDVTVFGRRDVHDSERKPTEGLKHLRSEAPLIILDHNPRDYRENFSLGAFLTLSGHTHGGQTFPGNIAQKIFMKTPVYGHLEEGGKHLIVTSGAGFWGPPLRIGTNNEIWSIDIIPADN